MDSSAPSSAPNSPAVLLAERATVMAPTNALTWMSLAELYAFNGEREKSWAAWRRCLALNLPRNDEASPFIRTALSVGSDPARAAEMAIPERTDREEAAGNILVEMGQYKAAEEMLRRAVEKNKGSRLAYARMLYKGGRYAQAATAYQAATRQMPSDSGAFAGLGASRLAQKKPDAAIQAYQRAARISPRSSGFHAALGKAYEQKGDKGRARAAFKKALALNPRNLAASRGLARVGGVE